MSTTPLSFRLPSPITGDMAHPAVAQAINNNTNQGLDNLSAIVALKTQLESLKAPATSASTASAASASTTTTSSFPGQGTVTNQTGNTAYATQASDNGALITVSNASPVAISLNSTATAPYYVFVTNFGAGIATLTPTNGVTINGAASFSLNQNYTALVVFSMGVWWATAIPIVPANFNAVAHEWISSYNSSTGMFSATQPAFSDLTGSATTAQIGTGTAAAGKYVDGAAGAWTPLPTVPTTSSPVAGEYVTGYNATTGNFSVSTSVGISVTITTAALTLGGTQGSQVFTNGLLTSQVQAT